ARYAISRKRRPPPDSVNTPGTGSPPPAVFPAPLADNALRAPRRRIPAVPLLGTARIPPTPAFSLRRPSFPATIRRSRAATPAAESFPRQRLRETSRHGRSQNYLRRSGAALRQRRAHRQKDVIPFATTRLDRCTPDDGCHETTPRNPAAFSGKGPAARLRDRSTRGRSPRPRRAAHASFRWRIHSCFRRSEHPTAEHAREKHRLPH